PFLEFLFKLFKPSPFFIIEKIGNLGMDCQRRFGSPDIEHFAAQFPEDLIADSGFGFYIAAPFTVRAGLAHHPSHALPDTFPGHFDQPEFGDLQDVGFRLVTLQCFFQRTEDLLPVHLFFHIDEVYDNDSADIPESELVGDLFHRLQIGLEDGVFEIVLANISACVYVYSSQGFRLLDDYVAAALQPYFSSQGAAYLHFQAIVVEHRLFFVVKLDGVFHLGHESGYELDDAIMLRL